MKMLPLFASLFSLITNVLAANPSWTNVWSTAGAGSVSFEFRLTDPKGQLTVHRRADEAKPRLRMDTTVSILQACARGGTWNGDKGREEWKAGQLNLSFFGQDAALKLNEWYRARVVTHEDSQSLLLFLNGRWREVYGCAHPWSTKETSLAMTVGTAEVRNVEPAPAGGRGRFYEVDCAGRDLRARFATGDGRVVLRLDFADGTDKWICANPRANTIWCLRKKNGQDDWYSREVRDACLQIDGFKFFSPAHAWAYEPNNRAAQIDYIEAHPEELAINRPLTMRFGADGEVWYNGSYMGNISNQIVKAALYVPDLAPKGEVLESVAPEPIADRLVLKPTDCPGVTEAEDGQPHLDISKHREHSSAGQETDHYFDRNGLDGFKDAFCWMIPNKCWATARVVAAEKPDKPTNAVPILTVRLTRNGFAGYGNACAEGQIDLVKSPRRKVGTAKVGGTSVDLYEYLVTLPVGDIQDRLYVKRGQARFGKAPYLSVELVGPLGRPGILWDKSHKPDWETVSSALVFGFELLEAPCEMELLQSQPGLIFADDEQRETTVRVKANKAGAYVFRSEIRDWDGKKVKSFKLALALKADEERRVPLDLAVGEGWYSLDVSLTSQPATHNLQIVHHATFCDVGKCDRKAGYESPYSFWWYGQHHGATADIEIMGPIFRKLGIRRLSAIQGQHTEESMKKYGLTLSQIPFNINLAMPALSKRPIAGMVTEYEAWLRQTLEEFPHVERRAIVFHESYCGGHPYYLWDGTDKPDVVGDDAKKRFELAVALCRMIREKFPDMKIQLGNSSTSYEICDVMLRQKFPKELFDYLGSETVARFECPDKPAPSAGPASLVYLNRVADHYGYPQRANVCYEWVSMLPREITEFERPEWGLRNTLLAFAAGATMVPIAGSTPDDCYFNSDYGGVSTVERYPYLYPQRGFYANAVMTRELDCAKFSRRVDTGSQTVNALEFRREGSECVYALWLPRGRAEVTLDGAKVLRAVAIDGRRQKASETVALGQRPVFVTTGKPLGKIAIVSRETPPQVEPKNYQLAAPLKSVQEVSVEPTNNWMYTYLAEDKYRRRGVFTVEQGEGCVTLKRDRGAPLYETLWETTYLKLNAPVVLKGEPATLSLEVDGNSSWAQVLFYVEDAEGKLFTPTGIWYEGDARGNGAVNFDGWGTLQFPLTKKSRVKTSEVDAQGGFWRCDARGRKGASKDLVYPVKVVGFAISMPRHTISGGVFEPVKKNPDTLRFRNLGVFE